MGRILSDIRATSALTKTIPYTYNLDGSLASITYRQDHYPETFNYTQGGAGRPISAGTSSFGLAYYVHYAPNGSLCSLYSSWGQVFEHNYTFNNRLQITGIQDWDETWYANDHGSAPPPCTVIADGPEVQLHLTYSYADANGHNNGNVAQIANNLDVHRWQLFTYDSLNRLATANTSTTNQPMWQGDTNALPNCWGEQFAYDPWGNLYGISPVSSAYTGCTQESLSMSPTTKNQLQDTNNDYVYDAAGNTTQPGPTGGPYVYDAENHLISAGGMAYLYDGDGKRVAKAPANTPTQPNYFYWYGTGPQILEETDNTGAYLYTDAYFNGQLLARGEPDWTDHFFTDALGNTRCVYGDGDPDGGCSDYYPFGAERPITNGGVNVSFKFTGKERDSETGLDNFGARFDSSSLGRFMSPDWVANAASVPYADFGNPQSLNLYSYVKNNPINASDPDGHCDGEHCDTIAVSAKVSKEPEVTSSKNGRTSTATVAAEVQYTITQNGKPMADTPIHEEVSNKVSRNGVPEQSKTVTRDDSTNKQGVIGDITSYTISTDAPSLPGTNLAEQILTTSTISKETTQTLTIGSTGCQVTEVRTLSNKSGDYKLTLQSPETQKATPVPTPPPPVPTPPPPQKPQTP